MKRLGFVVILMLAVMSFLPATASAATTTSYQFHLEVPNVSADSHGDRVAVTGNGDFTENQKSVCQSVSFTHFSAGSGSVTGMWVLYLFMDLLPYGCVV